MASFFREDAQDLMLIEGIESRVKDAIRAVYADDDDGLCSAIATVTDRGAEVRKKLPGAIRAYVAKASISPPALGADMVALAEAEKKLGLQERSKDFEDLTFDEFTSVLLRHARAPRLSLSKDVSEPQRLKAIMPDDEAGMWSFFHRHSSMPPIFNVQRKVTIVTHQDYRSCAEFQRASSVIDKIW
jgi:hypothetical protein